MNDEDLDAMRAMARHSAESATDGRKRILEEHSAAFRWLMASLLAVNGAGLVFLKDAKFESTEWIIFPAIAFYFGIVFALAIAWLGQRSARRTVEVMSEMAVFWTMVAHSGQFDEEHFQRLSEKVSNTLISTRLAPIGGWMSLLAFTAGLMLVAVGWKT